MPLFRSRTAARAAAVTAIAAGSLWLLASPALAHVEVSAKPAQAGAKNAVVSFDAEAESNSSGIAGIKIQLPAGISAGQVSLVSAPSGWTMTTPQGVLTLTGKALPVKRNATYAIRVAQLPSPARTLVFKTIVSYTDGHDDSWIELPGGGELASPAPVLSLAPAAPTTVPTTVPATTAAPATVAPTPTAAPPTTAAPTPAPSTAAAADTDDGGPGAGLWIGIAVAVVVVVGVGAFLARRSRAA